MRFWYAPLMRSDIGQPGIFQLAVIPSPSLCGTVLPRLDLAPNGARPFVKRIVQFLPVISAHDEDLMVFHHTRSGPSSFNVFLFDRLRTPLVMACQSRGPSGRDGPKVRVPSSKGRSTPRALEVAIFLGKVTGNSLVQSS